MIYKIKNNFIWFVIGILISYWSYYGPYYKKIKSIHEAGAEKLYSSRKTKIGKKLLYTGTGIILILAFLIMLGNIFTLPIKTSLETIFLKTSLVIFFSLLNGTMINKNSINKIIIIYFILLYIIFSNEVIVFMLLLGINLFITGAYILMANNAYKYNPHYDEIIPGDYHLN